MKSPEAQKKQWIAGSVMIMGWAFVFWVFGSSGLGDFLKGIVRSEKDKRIHFNVEVVR